MEKETLYEAFAKAHAEFKVPVKDKTAHYGKYASIGSINEATREALSKNGLSVIQPILTKENRQYVQTLLLHTNGGLVESLIPIPEINPNTKNYFHALGSAISYLRRYALQAMLNISADDVEDDGDSLNDVKVNQHKFVSDEQAKSLNDMFVLLDSPAKKIAYDALLKFKAQKFTELKLEDYDKYRTLLSNLVEKQQQVFEEELKDV